jgi:hypothetical protein
MPRASGFKAELGERFAAALRAERELEADWATDFAAFDARFQENAKGNAVARYKGLTLTVYRTRAGAWSWCVADGAGEPLYSIVHHPTERGAMLALWEHLEW